MKTFIEEVVSHVLAEYGEKTGDVTIVFPNRRAGLFFSKILSSKIDKPIWMPHVYSMEDFVLSLSPIEKIDTVEAVFDLYDSYISLQPSAEAFDKFYFWGEMIIKDFEEVDHYLINPNQLFTSIKSQKELDEEFYFLTPEERETISQFWSTFLPEATKTQLAFIATWKILLPLYQDFKKRLLAKNKGYGGMIYRHVTELMKEGKIGHDNQLIFAGFNALTGAEEQILKYFVKETNAHILWDCDAYYLNNPLQESGYFMRQYAVDSVLGKTFRNTELIDRISQPKKIALTGVALEIGQVKALSEKLSALIKEKDFVPEKTVIVLAHEYMLFPVLHALPPEIDKVNITMGYPLKDTPVYTLLDSLMQLQHSIRKNQVGQISFYAKPVLDILNHPLLTIDQTNEGIEKALEIHKRNLIYIPKEELIFKSPVLNLIFSKAELPISYLQSVLDQLYVFWENKGHDLELEFISRFYVHLTELQQMMGTKPVLMQIDFLIKLFRKIARSLKIPFSGEPLQGLQIMGILETRNLDFDHVFILNMNEDAWPASPKQGSFIPYNIRKGFSLPVQEHQDAIYAYLFYRLLQRSKTIDVYYNTVSEFNVNGDLSRFMKQLISESGLKIAHQKLANKIVLRPPESISIQKDQYIFNRLGRFTTSYSGKFSSKLTPSALDTYLTCRLKFYFRYIEEIYEPDELSEELDSMSFGNIVHDALEILYDQFIKKQKRRNILPADFFWLKSGIGGAINQAFIKQFHIKNEKKFVPEGRNIIAAEMVTKLVSKIIDMDEKYAPFEILGLEASTREGFFKNVEIPTGNGKVIVQLKGKIDRIDLKNDMVRILDYKTGKDVKSFETLESLTNGKETKRNKAAFQVMFYSYLFHHLHPGKYPQIVPGLFNSKDLFSEDFSWQLTGKINSKSQKIENYIPLHDEFSSSIQALLEEIWNPAVSFDQTSDIEKCKYCAYAGICRKGNVAN